MLWPCSTMVLMWACYVKDEIAVWLHLKTGDSQRSRNLFTSNDQYRLYMLRIILSGFIDRVSGHVLLAKSHPTEHPGLARKIDLPIDAFQKITWFRFAQIMSPIQAAKRISTQTQTRSDWSVTKT